MIKQEIKEMSLDELKVSLKDKKSLLEDLRFQKALQQLENPLQIRLIRKEIAQIKTIINQHDLDNKKIFLGHMSYFLFCYLVFDSLYAA